MVTPRINPSSFLFINETLQSKHKEPRSRPSVQRHVQRYHAEKARIQKNASLKSNVQKTQQLLGWLERDQSKSSSSAVKQDKRPQHFGNSETDDIEASSQESYLIRERSKLLLLPQTQPSIGRKYSSSLSGMHFGSFAFAGVEYDDMVHRSIQYFTSNWKPFACKCDVDTPLCTWPGKVNSSHCPEHILSINEIVRRCLYDKMHMYALIATCAARIRSVDNDIVEHIDRPEIYMAKAINLLQNFLRECPVVDEQVVIDVYFLSTFEFYLKNYSGAQIYLRIIKSMVESLGGFGHLGEYARRLCWNGDISVALEHPSPPILPQIWTPRPLTMSATEQIGLEGVPALPGGMGSGFQHHRDFLSTDLLATVAEICSDAKLLKSAKTFHFSLDTQTIFERGTALLHRLLSSGPNADARRDLRSLKEDCCRYALALWVWNIFIRGAANAAADRPYTTSTDVADSRQMRPVIAKQLKKQIFRTCQYANEPTIDLVQYRLRLWIIGVGIFGAEPGKARDWYTNKFLQLANALDIRTIEQVATIFSTYLYLEESEFHNMKRLGELFSQAPATNLRRVVRAHGSAD